VRCWRCFCGDKLPGVNGKNNTNLSEARGAQAFGWDYQEWQTLHDERGEDLNFLEMLAAYSTWSF